MITLNSEEFRKNGELKRKSVKNVPSSFIMKNSNAISSRPSFYSDALEYL